MPHPLVMIIITVSETPNKPSFHAGRAGQVHVSSQPAPKQKQQYANKPREREDEAPPQTQAAPPPLRKPSSKDSTPPSLQPRPLNPLHPRRPTHNRHLTPQHSTQIRHRPFHSRLHRQIINGIRIAADKGPALLLVVIEQVGVRARAARAAGAVGGGSRRRGSGLAPRLVLARLGADELRGVLQVAVDAFDGGVDAVFLLVWLALFCVLWWRKGGVRGSDGDVPYGSALPTPSL